MTPTFRSLPRLAAYESLTRPNRKAATSSSLRRKPSISTVDHGATGSRASRTSPAARRSRPSRRRWRRPRSARRSGSRCGANTRAPSLTHHVAAATRGEGGRGEPRSSTTRIVIAPRRRADAVRTAIPVAGAEHGAHARFVVVRKARRRKRRGKRLALERRRRNATLARLAPLSAQAGALFLGRRRRRCSVRAVAAAPAASPRAAAGGAAALLSLSRSHAHGRERWLGSHSRRAAPRPRDSGLYADSCAAPFTQPVAASAASAKNGRTVRGNGAMRVMGSLSMSEMP